MLFRILHETRLTYTEPVSETVLEVRMSPPSNEDQTNLGYRLRLSPTAPLSAYLDGFGNRVDLFNILSPYEQLIIRSSCLLRTHRRAGEERLATVAWDPSRDVPVAAQEFLQHSPLVERDPALAEVADSLPPPLGSMLQAVTSVMDTVKRRIVYEKLVTASHTSVGEVLKLGRGVCQDFSHVFIGVCRHIGIPARYVSGYVYEPGEVATHAWCQVWDGTSGWLDVDPTRGHFVGDDYVVTAVGRDYNDVPPNRGVWKGHADETISVSVKVEPLDRLPADWSEWSMPTVVAGESWSQSQRNQAPKRIGARTMMMYRQQQSQQQQSR